MKLEHFWLGLTFIATTYGSFIYLPTPYRKCGNHVTNSDHPCKCGEIETQANNCCPSPGEPCSSVDGVPTCPNGVIEYGYCKTLNQCLDQSPNITTIPCNRPEWPPDKYTCARGQVYFETHKVCRGRLVMHCGLTKCVL